MAPSKGCSSFARTTAGWSRFRARSPVEKLADGPARRLQATSDCPDPEPLGVRQPKYLRPALSEPLFVSGHDQRWWS
jgi:hypothetical protein